MADHVRAQLRNAVAVAVTGLTTTGANVFKSHVYDLENAALPALLVYTTGEEVTDESIGDLIERTVQMVIEGKTKAAANLDDTLDQIAKEVEVALSVPMAVGGQSVVMRYDGCDIEMTDAERPAGVVSLRFSAALYTRRLFPDVVG